MTQMICVWPLVEGLQGVDGAGQVGALVLGRRGWMAEPEAEEAFERDEVQFMAGENPLSLKTPRYGTRAAKAALQDDPLEGVDGPERKGKGAYRTRQLKAGK